MHEAIAQPSGGTNHADFNGKHDTGKQGDTGYCTTRPSRRKMLYRAYNEGGEYIYKLTARDKDNFTHDTVLCYREDIEDPSKDLEAWQTRLGEASTLRCIRLTKDPLLMVLEGRNEVELGLSICGIPILRKGLIDPRARNGFPMSPVVSADSGPMCQTTSTTMTQLGVRRLVLKSSPLKALTEQILKILWLWAKSYLGSKLVLGGDWQLSQSGNLSVKGTPKSLGR